MITKLILLFSAVLITLMGLNSCKKDYPRDIPDWLKEKIKERKNTCEKRGCYCNDGSGLCWTIKEYNQNGEIKFVIIEGQINLVKTIEMKVYSFDGELICSSNVIGSFPDSFQGITNCDNVLQSNLTRDIWNESPSIY